MNLSALKLILTALFCLLLVVSGLLLFLGGSWSQNLLLLGKELRNKAAPVQSAAGVTTRYNGPECRDEGDVRPGQPRPYCGDLPSLAALNIREATLQKIPVELDSPWAFEFLSDSELLVTEFGGELKRVDVVTGESILVEGLPEISSGGGQRGLLDVALHPGFEDNKLIYFSYALDDGEGKYATAVARAQLNGSQLDNVERIFLALPFGKSSSNFGGALMFDRDGFLFIATGDRSDRSDAQHPSLLTGKIIRLNDDGSIPASNPFVGAEQAIEPAIYALGVRNPQGLVQDTVTGNIFETEHGPMGGDEVNLVVAGKNYGWPTITYGANYSYKPIGEGPAKDGLEQPLFYYLPSIAISPIEVYRGAMFPEWEGDLLVGALKGAAISKLDLVAGRVQSEYEILGELSSRVRDIKVASDGAVWVLLQTGYVYRLSRASNPMLQSVEPGQRDGETVYLAVCSSCHSKNVPAVPQISVQSDWTERLAKGRKVLFRNSIQGYKGMPEKGLCEDCTNKEIKRAVAFIIGQVK